MTDLISFEQFTGRAVPGSSPAPSAPLELDPNRDLPSMVESSVPGLFLSPATGQVVIPGQKPAAPPPGLISFEDFTKPAEKRVGADGGEIRTGMAANFAARANEGIAGMLGAPADIANAISSPAAYAGQQVGRWLRDVTGRGPSASQIAEQETGAPQPPRLLPGGSADIQSGMGLLGIDPRNVEAGDVLDRLAGGAGAGVTAMVGPQMAAQTLARGGYQPASVAGRAILDAFRGSPGVVSPAVNAGIGAVSGVGGSLAEEYAPEPWKPLANAAGQLATGGLLAGTYAGGRALYGVTRDQLGHFISPLTEAGRRDLAGSRIYNAASDPAALVERLGADNPELVPGSRPTAFQLTGDQGVGQLERATATANPEPFLARRGEQNAARLGAVDAMVPEGASGSAPGEFFRRQLADIDATNDRLVQAARERGDARVTGAQAAADAGVTGAQQRADRGLQFAQQYGERTIQGAQEAADAAAARGVRLEGGELNRDQYGAALRNDHLAPAKAQAKANESRLWNQIDPDGKLALDVSAVKERANELARGLPQSAKPQEGEERGIFGVARLMPDVQKFSELTALRGRLLGAIREERFARGETPALRRMTLLRSAIDSAISSAADQEAAAGRGSRPAEAGGGGGLFNRPGAVAASAAGEPGAGGSIGSRVYTPSGRALDVRYRVVDLAGPEAPITSHTSDLQPNPAYPAELQPRDRTRAASELQVASIGGNLQPERLGPSHSVTEGAPIIGPGGVVESGNARLLGLARAYAENRPGAQAYKDYLRSQGHNVEGMQRPALVRERLTDLSPDERVKFTQEANGPAGLGMSAPERARVDAQRLPGSVLDLYRGGEINSAENRDFVRAFVRSVAEGNEAGTLASADGSLSMEGTQRIRNALLHKAYGDSSLVASLAETGDENIRVFGRGLADAAGDVAKLRSEIAAGRVRPEMDISRQILDAAGVVRDARSRGVSIAAAMHQQDVFRSLSPVAEEVLRAAYGDNLDKRISVRDLSNILRFYAEEAGKQSTEAQLFGGGEVAPRDIFSLARSRYGTAEAYGPGGGAGARSGYGTGGQGGLEPGAGAPGQAAARGARRADSASILPQESLEPNFDSAAAARYRAAADATRARAGTFNQGPVNQALRSRGNAGDFALADSQVASRFFNGGARAHEDAQAYVRAVGSRPEALRTLEDYAVSEIRRSAERADGSLDARKAQAWVDKHYDALRSFPELAQRFRDAAATARTVEGDLVTAQRAAREAAQHAAEVLRVASREGAQGVRQAELTGRRSVAEATGQSRREVTDATSAAREAHDAYLATAARHFINAEPNQAVARALGGGRPEATMAELARMTAGNPDARAGLQRAVVDYIRGRFISNTEAGTSGTELLRSDQLQTWVRRNSMALAPILSPEQIQGLQAVAADLQRANRSIAGSRLPGQSNTAQDLGAGGRFGSGSSVLRRMVTDAAGGVAGFFTAGPAGGIVGWLGGNVVAGLRDAGIRNVDQLVSAAMLNPGLARDLVMEFRAGQRPDRVILRDMAQQLGRLSVAANVGALGPGADQRRAAR